MSADVVPIRPETNAPAFSAALDPKCESVTRVPGSETMLRLKFNRRLSDIEMRAVMSLLNGGQQ